LLAATGRGHDLGAGRKPKTNGPRDVIELLQGIGTMLQEIDAKLGRLIELLGGDE
jgi:hypothetical protein